MARETKNLLVNELHDRALAQVAVHARGRLLDIGAGRKPYERMFAPYVAEHVGLDHADTIHGLERIDLVGSAYDIPVTDGSFDTILCTMVLEHLEEPLRALREARRVLAPGGLAIYSMPFIWHLHEEPRDFFRYSKHGLRYLFEQAGFAIEEIRPLSGFWATFGQLFVYYLQRAQAVPIIRRLRTVDAAALLIQAGAYLLDRLDRREEWTWAYLVVARTADHGGDASVDVPR